jgi:hypothetical protein
MVAAHRKRGISGVAAMIARFQVYIPFLIFVQADLLEHVAPEEVTVGDLKAHLYPPYRSQLEVGDARGESAIVPSDIPRRLEPADPQPVVPDIQIGPGSAIVGDVLRIDFLRDQFNRRHGSDDPPTALAFNLANSWLRRFRVLNRVGWAKPLSEHTVPWKLALLNDDETEVEPVEGQWRRRLGAALRMQYTALDSYGWNAITALPFNYEAQPSDELLLDADALLPQVGPAIVLAYAAVETRITGALDRLAALTGLNSALWSWLTDRGDFRKDPSPAEQLDMVSSALTGRSLKGEPQLWEAFQNLRDARNRFVHEGKASVGRQRLEVDGERARQLVSGAGLIVDWIESLLPEAERRPRAQSPNQVTVARLFYVPGSEVSPVDARVDVADTEERDGPEQETETEDRGESAGPPA